MPTDKNLPILTVAELGALVESGVSSLFPNGIWVEGQIPNLHTARSGHTYFDLTESVDQPGAMPQALFGVTLWRGNRSAIEESLSQTWDLAIDNDLVVRIHANLNFYIPRGRIQLNMTDIDPDFTLGQLAAGRDRILHALVAENLLTKNSALPFPLPSLKIGLITSHGSAAHADFQTELERSGIGFTVVERDTQVQGHASAKDIAEGLRILATYQPDVIAIVRGGGSTADLASFDAEIVARTIADLNIPVLTGIGHEIDRSIADEVAHTAYKTPTACAAALVVAARHALDELITIKATITDRANGILLRAARDHNYLAQQLRQSVTTLISWKKNGLSVAEDRFTRSLKSSVTREYEQLERLGQQLRLLDPTAILERGWSITHTANGKPIRSATQVVTGDSIKTQFVDGTVSSTVV